MKSIFFLLFFLSSYAFANYIEIDANKSSMSVFDKKMTFSGYIDREDSKLEISSEDISFSAEKFSNGEEFFEIEGILTYHGQSRGAKLFARDLGNSNYHIRNSEIDIKLVGLKTQDEKNDLVTRIQEIVR